MKTSTKVITISVIIAALAAVWFFFIRKKDEAVTEPEATEPPKGMGLNPDLKQSVSSMPAAAASTAPVAASEPARGALVAMSQEAINNLKESAPAAYNAWEVYKGYGWIIPKEYPNITWSGTATKTTSLWEKALRDGITQAQNLGDKAREARAKEALRIELYTLARYGVSTKPL